MRFLILTYENNWKVGGYLVLNRLAKLLKDRGHDVTGVGTAPSPHFPVVHFSEASQIAQQKDVWTLYPEAVPGNPFHAQNIVRWILYYPGLNRGDREFGPGEVVLTYQKIFVQGTKYENVPVLRITESRADVFFDKGEKRELDAVLIKKGAKTFQQRNDKYAVPFADHFLKIMFVDSELDRMDDFEGLNGLYNRARYFISFDCETYHVVMAAMAGCISIIVPQDGMSKEQLFDRFENYKYGIAYGFDDLNHALQTQHLVHDHARRLEKDNEVNVDRLIQALSDRL